MEGQKKHCDNCKWCKNDVADFPCDRCANHNYWEAYDARIIEPIIGEIQQEMYKLNAEGEFVYSKSEIRVFDKCIEILKEKLEGES